MINILVSRTGGSSGIASVDYATADNTAAGGSDYTVANGTLTWPNGVSGNRTISIPILDDAAAEHTESFSVTLSNVSVATLAPNSSATVDIIDNDVAALSTYGAISELSSATVNGIRYNTDAASVIVNGQPAIFSDLQIGQAIALEGEANLSEGTGTADLIGYSASIIGPVENIDASLQQMIVLGQTVLIDADTVFDPSIDPDTFAGLAIGAIAEISGFLNADGNLIARRIEPDTASTGVQLIGTVAGLDSANLIFSINRLTVDYSSPSVIDLPGGMPANGLLVIVRGSLTNGILVVDEIASSGSLTATAGERVYLGGLITRFASAADFDLNGLQVTMAMNTRFVNGIVDDLQANAEITIDGEVTSAGDTVLANEVCFGPLPSDRKTSTFNFSNFTNISVLGLARVTVSQGTDFSIEVTADSDIINDVQVIRAGDTVSFEPPIGINNSQLFSAVVIMPVLNQIDIGANAIANVLLKDFNQTQLTGSVSTGQGTGSSSLFYYGTAVTENVTTDSLSTVILLGGSRP